MTLLFVAAITSCSSQDITLTCAFQVLGQTNYICNLREIEVLDPEANVTLVGDHIEDRTNADVTAVIIRYSNTPFVIQQIFTTFESLNTLEIEDSHLQSFSIPENVLLQRLQVDGNNISRIESGLLQAQSELIYFSAIDSNIVEIDEDAFVGLTALTDLVLIGNFIEQIAPQTFNPLTNLRYLDLEANRLTSLGDELFSQNPDLHSIYLEHNQISEISPKFTANLLEGLNYINLADNVCVNRGFQIGTEENLIVMNNLLRGCFNNFSGRTTDEREISSEFRGSLRIYDEFGNLIGRV